MIQLLSAALHRIYELEEAIKLHRDEKGHGRCKQDDQRLYSVIRDGVEADFTLPPKEEWMRECERYYDLRGVQPV